MIVNFRLFSELLTPYVGPFTSNPKLSNSRPNLVGLGDVLVYITDCSVSGELMAWCL